MLTGANHVRSDTALGTDELDLQIPIATPRVASPVPSVPFAVNEPSIFVAEATHKESLFVNVLTLSQ